MTEVNEIKYENLQNVYYNGKPVSIAEQYVFNGQGWVYNGVVSVEGHWKRISTFIKKIVE